MVDRERITTATRVIREDGFIRVVGRGVEHTPATVQQTLSAIRELGDGQRVRILFDARSWGAAGVASWVEFLKNIEVVCTAAAVVVDSDEPIQVGAFPSTLDRLVIPFRSFTSETEARAFLAAEPG